MLVTQESKGQNTNQFESFTISLTLRSLLLSIFQVSRGGVGWGGVGGGDLHPSQLTSDSFLQVLIVTIVTNLVKNCVVETLKCLQIL